MKTTMRIITRAITLFIFALVLFAGKPATAKAAAKITWTGYYTKGVTYNNATVGVRVNSTVKGKWTKASAVIYNTKGTAIASKTEKANYNYTYMNIWYNISSEMKKNLSPNTQYYVRFSAVYNGKTYTSGKYSFKTIPVSRVTKMNAFIKDSRWKNGVSWPQRAPKLSTYKSLGCCAYAADFVKYVYNSNNLATGKKFTKVSEIKAGDVIHLSNHWFVVIARNGNNLTTAEGAFSNKVRVTSKGYYLNGGKLAGTKQAFVFGYHYY